MGRTAARQLLAVGGVLAVGLAYFAVVTALNAPDGAHASDGLALGVARPSSSTTSTTAVTVSPSSTTTTTTGPPIVPGPLQSPKPGTYPVRVTVDGQISDGTELVSADGTRRLTIGSSVRGSKLRWSASRVELTQTDAAAGEGTCLWAPPVLNLVANLAEGRTWSSDSTCTTSAGKKAVATFRRQETAKVTGRTRTHVGDASVDTWSIARHVIITREKAGKTEVTEEASTELFAPSLGLTVNRIVRTDTSRADGSVASVVQFFELKSVTPA